MMEARLQNLVQAFFSRDSSGDLSGLGSSPVFRAVDIRLHIADAAILSTSAGA